MQSDEQAAYDGESPTETTQRGSTHRITVPSSLVVIVPSPAESKHTAQWGHARLSDLQQRSPCAGVALLLLLLSLRCPLTVLIEEGECLLEFCNLLLRQALGGIVLGHVERKGEERREESRNAAVAAVAAVA